MSGEMSIYDFLGFDEAMGNLVCDYVFSKFADWNEATLIESESEKMKRVANEFMNEIKYAPRFSINKSV